jgi:copper chaperone CopZ
MRTTLRLHLPSIHAIRAVETALQAVEGIVHAEVTRAGVTIDHDGRATADRLRDAVGAAGFELLEIVEEGRRLAVRPNEE